MVTTLKFVILRPIRSVVAVVTTVWAWFGAGRVRRAMRAVLLSIGAVVVFAVTCMMAMLAYLTHRVDMVRHVADAIKPGMTINEVVAVFPADFFYARIGVPLPTNICKDVDGHIVPPYEESFWFPDTAEGDAEGEKLSWDARQSPLRLDRLELLDKHLRGRKDWDALVKMWTVYIQDKRDQAEPVSFSRRGTAYLALDDFDHGYKDLKTACKLGSKEGCAAVAALPKFKVTTFEVQQRRIIATAPACELPVSSYDLQPSENLGDFSMQVYAPHSTGIPASKAVSRTKLAELFRREFAGREWGAEFTFQTETPLRLAFSFVVGRDGKVKEVCPVSGWD